MNSVKTGAYSVFQSPPPMREATAQVEAMGNAMRISIPASHAGGDVN